MRRAGWVGGALLLALTTACGLAPEAAPDDAAASPEASAPASGQPSPGGRTRQDDGPIEVPQPTAAPSSTPSQPVVPTRDPLADLVEDIEIADEPVLGADVSWPQCPPGMGIPQKRSHGGPMPVPEAEYVVVGLTNGPGFYPNPCLADQVEWVRSRGLMIGAYAVASYPEQQFIDEHGADGPYDGSTELGALANTGYQQALYNVALMKDAGLLTPLVWIDVEPVPDFEWSADREANASVVAGVARGYQDAGYAIGVYSTPYLWEGVVGDFSLGVPEWRAAGQTSREEALGRCSDEWVIQGGAAVLGQWVQDARDMNVTCPGIATDLSAWFHRY